MATNPFAPSPGGTGVVNPFAPQSGAGSPVTRGTGPVGQAAARGALDFQPEGVSAAEAERHDPGFGRFALGAAKRSVVTPLSGILETVGFLREGATDEQKEEFEELQRRRLEGNPSTARFLESLFTRVAADSLPIIPAAGLARVGAAGARGAAALGAGARAQQFAAGAVGPAIEGALIGVGETAGADLPDRIVGTFLGASLGATAGGAIRAVSGRLNTDPLDPDAPAIVRFWNRELTSKGLLPADIKKQVDGRLAASAESLFKVGSTAAEFNDIASAYKKAVPDADPLKVDDYFIREIEKPEEKITFDGVEDDALRADLVNVGRRMRSEINDATKALQDAGAVGPEQSDLFQILEQNRSQASDTNYLARTFDAFSNDPAGREWPDFVFPDEATLRRVRAGEDVGDAAFEGKAMVYVPSEGRARPVFRVGYEFLKEQLARDNVEASFDDIINFMHGIVTKGQDENAWKLMGGEIPKPFEGLFKKKKEVPEPVLALLGAKRSPAAAYFDTVTRQVRALEDFKLMQMLKENSEGKLFWRNAAEVPGGPSKAVQIGSLAERGSVKTTPARVAKGTRPAVISRGQKVQALTLPKELRSVTVRQASKTGQVTVGLKDGTTREVPIGTLRNKGGRTLHLSGEARALRRPKVEEVAAGDQGPFFTTAEFGEILFGARGQRETGYLMAANAFAKQAKTVWSFQTQARNFLANPLLLVMNGHFPYRLSGEGIGAARAPAIRGLSNLLSGRKANAPLAIQKREFIADAIRHGVAGDNVNVGDLDFYEQELQSFLRAKEKGGGNLATKALRHWNRLLEKTRIVQNNVRGAYQLGDEYWKIVLWKQEIDQLRWAQPEKSLADVKAEAAEIVRNQMPTYSQVPKAVQRLRRNPIVGTFVSFPAEIFRNFKNTTKRGLYELGGNHGNARLRTIGAKRLGGIATALSLPGATAAMLRHPEANDEHEQAVKAHVAPWMQASQLVLQQLDTENKEVRVFDTSFMDPLSYLKRPFLAALGSGYLDEEGVGAAASEFFRTFVGPELATTAVFEVAANKKGVLEMITGQEGGGEVFNSQDTTATKVSKSLGRFHRGLAPGVLNSLERITRGAAGTKLGADAGLNEVLSPFNRYGTKYELGPEVLALVGPRMTTVKLPTSLSFRSNSFNRSKRDARRIWNEEKNNAKTTAARKRRARARAQLVYREAFSEFEGVVRASRKLGMNDQEIFRVLKDNAVPVKDIRRLLMGAGPAPLELK